MFNSKHPFILACILSFVSILLTDFYSISAQTRDEGEGHKGCGIYSYSRITEHEFNKPVVLDEEFDRESNLDMQFRLTDYRRSETYVRLQVETKFQQGGGPISNSFTIQGGHQWTRGSMESYISSLSVSYKLARYKRTIETQSYTYSKQGVLFRCILPDKPSPTPLISIIDSGWPPDLHAAGYWPAMGNVNTLMVGDFREEWVEGRFFYKWYWRKTAAVPNGSPSESISYVWKLYDSRDNFMGENTETAPLINMAHIHGNETLRLLLTN